jgi:tetratricopeptide (TPR) repeat protein
MRNIDTREMTSLQRMSLVGRAQQELARNPRNVEAWLTLAGLQGAEKNFDAAIASLQKALAIRKKDPDILRRLLGAANDKNDMPLAKKFARKLTEIEPRNPDNYKSLGLIVETMGFPREAIEIYLKADVLQPGTAQTRHDIGRCFGLLGKHDKAIEWFRLSLDADPHYPFALYNYAVSRKFGPAEADMLIKQCLAAESRPECTADPAQHANLHYAIGKLHDETGRPAEAFVHFARANQLRDPGVAEIPAHQFVNMTDAFRKETFQSGRPFGLETRQPVFVCGMPRSGTTLVESLCGGHSQVTAGDEQVFMSEIATALGARADVPGAFRRNIEQLGSRELQNLGNRYLASCRHIAGTTAHFTDKLPHNFLNIGLIGLIFPNARIILCRRHPMDNCFSLYSNSMSKFHNQYKTRLTKLGLYYLQYWQLVEHWRQVLPGRFMEVMYEDVVANTELNARAMISHLGLEWEDGVMDRTGSQRSVRTLSGWQVRQPIYQTSKGRWRTYEKELEPLREILEPCVKAYESELAALSQKAMP